MGVQEVKALYGSLLTSPVDLNAHIQMLFPKEDVITTQVFFLPVLLHFAPKYFIHFKDFIYLNVILNKKL